MVRIGAEERRVPACDHRSAAFLVPDGGCRTGSTRRASGPKTIFDWDVVDGVEHAPKGDVSVEEKKHGA